MVPLPLKIPTPTPAPDRGGPVAYLGGPVTWCLDVVSVTLVLQFIVLLVADVGSLGVQNVSFGMPVASTLAPLGSMDRSRGVWEQKKGDLGVQASPRLRALGQVMVICWFRNSHSNSQTVCRS